uniref:SEC61 translocon subunit alpha 1 n=1 Tax=Homo sapiens TaxID=9606 RepID=A0A8V8TPD8_HUMAN
MSNFWKSSSPSVSSCRKFRSQRGRFSLRRKCCGPLSPSLSS